MCEMLLASTSPSSGKHEWRSSRPIARFKRASGS
jgi:hypothetical protein